MALMKHREPNQVKWMGSRPGHNGTQVWAPGQATAAMQVVYTVPADLTLYLTHASLNVNALATGNGSLEVWTAAPGYHSTLLSHFYLTGVEGGSENASYWPPIEIPTGYRFRLYATGAGLTIRALLHGWVE